jgi:hypothetical protein
MSLRDLCRAHTATIERQSVTSTDSMSAQKTYSTTNRTDADLSDEINCRVVEASASQRGDYSMSGFVVSHVVYVEEADPAVDERDRIVHDGSYLYVQHVRNPDRLNRYWIVGCLEKKGNLPL